MVEAVKTQNPLLKVATGDEDLIRALRILAILCCPAPGRHREVREHAMKPLANDAEGVISAAASDRLKQVLADWAQGSATVPAPTARAQANQPAHR